MVVFGGSLGARRINDAVAGLAARWAGRTDRSIYHVVGRRDWEAVQASAAPGDGRACVLRVPYEDRMATALRRRRRGGRAGPGP